MPIEQPDNTRIERRPDFGRPVIKTSPIQPKQAQIYDADKARFYRNLQDFYNYNAWGYGLSGYRTNFDPSTSQGQANIQSNFNYAKSNVQNLGETLITTGVAEGIGQVARWATTPTKIGSGAEAIVTSAPLSPRVTKVTTIPKVEMHIRNRVPGALKAEHTGYNNGLHTYTQQKIRILSPQELAKSAPKIKKMMTNAGWREVTHPNLQGLGFTNGKWVVSDLGPGNVGKNWFGKIKFADFSIESVPEFRMAMQRKGGKLI